MAAHLGLPSLLFFRFVQGLAYSADFAAIGILCVRWAPLSQMSIFISTLTCFSSLSVIITDPAAAWLCDSSLGWRSAFYFHAAAGVVLFTLWAILYRDDPQLHPSVSEKELKKIQKDKTQAHIERTGFVPYKVRRFMKTVVFPEVVLPREDYEWNGSLQGSYGTCCDAHCAHQKASKSKRYTIRLETDFVD
ncbi:unnamed protein product [Nippostrongylus brasiliensis]|uniref:MFS domain-containing protein n=1 Tax=Nippostrongylus brasiliensis TaxID=27835 RepID=A0A0N4XPF9_NIPBR|nr:unnamed protein product [Nippostrongylus brasiliensis]